MINVNNGHIFNEYKLSEKSNIDNYKGKMREN